jgi:hypothetical protein
MEEKEQQLERRGHGCELEVGAGRGILNVFVLYVFGWQ